MGFFSEQFDKIKLKTNLKMAVTRLNLVQQKRANSVKLQKRQIAELLVAHKDESARIKVENLIREEYAIEAFEILQLFCEMLQSRLQLICESRSCPHDLKEAVSSIIWAAPRAEIDEFIQIRKQFELKYGKEFVLSCAENKDLSVNQRVMFKLSVKVPEPYLCVQYMTQIAREFEIPWSGMDGITGMEPPMGFDTFPNMNSGHGSHGFGPSGGNMGGGNMGGGMNQPNNFQFPPNQGGSGGQFGSFQGGNMGSTFPSNNFNNMNSSCCDTFPSNTNTNMGFPNQQHTTTANNTFQQPPQHTPSNSFGQNQMFGDSSNIMSSNVGTSQTSPGMNQSTSSSFAPTTTTKINSPPNNQSFNFGGNDIDSSITSVNNAPSTTNTATGFTPSQSEEDATYNFDDLQARFEALKKRN